MHLKFDEGAFTTAQDSTAGDHDGNLAGVSWVPSAMGTHAVLLDGTAAGIVTVPGLLGTAAVTLRPPDDIDGFPTTSGEVFSLGNYLAMRVSATDVRGFYYTGAIWSATIATVALGTTDSAHLAYTATPGSQKLYINGTLVASTTNAAPLVWTGRTEPTRSSAGMARGLRHSATRGSSMMPGSTVASSRLPISPPLRSLTIPRRCRPDSQSYRRHLAKYQYRRAQYPEWHCQ